MAGGFHIEDMTVADSQTINTYDILALSSGVVSQAIALPGSNNSFSASGGSTAQIGVALGSIVTQSNGVELVTGRTTVPVAIFDTNLEFLTRIYNATASSSEQSSVTLGTAYQFGRYRGASASQWFYCLSTTTSNGEWRITELSKNSASTDAYGFVWVNCVSADRQF
jgi:hypothetical protein